MALPNPILQCLVDQEPTAFHSSDASQETFSFAVNLSLDCVGTTAGDVKVEEDEGKQQYLDFLSAALKVEFHLYEVSSGPGWQLDYAGPVHSTSGSLATENPKVLRDWLDSQKPTTGTDRYWTSLSSQARIVVDADDANASHRLRAAQSWNAPVAHRFGLTHVVRVARDRIAAGKFVILPYFTHLTGAPAVPGFVLEHTGDEVVLDYDYDPQGGFGNVTGRANLIGEGITKPFSPSTIDSNFTDDGYIKVDGDAENVRRLLVWLEERAASLMTANYGLFPHGTSADDTEAFEQLFKIEIRTVEQPNKPTEFYWDGKAASWYAATRLVSALDNLVFALLKPVPPTSGAGVGASEGEVLAPFVSALIARIEREFASPDPELVDRSGLAAAIRHVIVAGSPLMSRRGGTPDQKDALFVKALRHVYGLPAAPKVFDEQTLVTALLEDFQTPGQKIDDASANYLISIKGQTAQTMSRALLELEQALHDEAGAEAAIVRLIETVETTADGSSPVPSDRLSALLANEITHDANLRPLVQRAVDAAWTDYRALLDSPFNGAEAIRRAAGSTFVLALLSYAEDHPSTKKKKPRTTSAYLLKLLRTSSFYEARFFNKPKQLPGLTDVLIQPDIARVPATAYFALRLQLRMAFYGAIEPLKFLNDPSARFIPDHAPQPLAIQIAANINGSKVDEFAKHLNGIAVAVQLVDSPGADLWAHANLTDLGWTPPTAGHDDPIDVKAAIHPMLPATSNGRSPMFIEYQGFPFSDRAIDARIIDSDSEPHDAKRQPFYRHDPHTDEDGFAKVPRLAYGRAFNTFSFVTTNAGTLPLALQLDPASPWMPKAGPPQPGPAAPPLPEPPPSPLLVGTAPYQRRTAIAQMTVAEMPATGRAPRIGAEIAGVTPLAKDYPRVALLAHPKESAVRDILREADGSGKMAARQNSEWRLSDIEFDGVPETLTLRFFDRPAKFPSDSGDATFVINEATVPGFTAISEIAVRVEFRVKKSGSFERWLNVRCGGTTLDPQQLADSDSVAGWLRLVLDTAGDGKRATMTFANIDAQKSDNVSDPLLLLAPKEAGTKFWKQGLADPVNVAVSTPRVGYLDFERWFANADLREDMFFRPGDEQSIKDAVKLFEKALISAYVMRHLDPGLAASIDRLPDPAVEQIQIELALHDTLTGHEPALGVTRQTLPLKETLGKFAREFHDLIDRMIAKEKVKYRDIDESDRDDPPWTPRRLRLYVLDPLDKLFQFKVALQSGDSVDLANLHQDPPAFSATVPEGIVARLSIDSLVPSERFEKNSDHPSVFHPGLMQYALRKLQGKYLAFPAAAVRIETMRDGMSELATDDPTQDRNQPAMELAAAMIAAEGIERTRRFDLMTSALPAGADAARHWRLLAEIDVTTQRWRNTGRPIYHFLNPRQYRFDGKPAKDAVPHPTLRLEFGDDGKDELAQFELEAFFDRPDIDAQTITKTLDPLPARTKLQEHYWNPESASYFRHRFRLRSRYAGALRERSRGEAIAWPTQDPTRQAAAQPKTLAHHWTMRVAMLADLSRIQLTRPQLRALIPLTTTPGDEDDRTPAPPVAAILQEPPFARGGLADRIASEVKTGFSYGFKTDVLEILDSRKEAGPDPRLDYRRLNENIAHGLVLRSEGPLGLTFDNIDAPAPAYPNSMFTLKPATLYGKEVPIEELFVGAAMRRYIDPDWTTEASTSDKELDGERCWWIVPEKSIVLPAELTCVVPGTAKSFAILKLEQDDTSITVSASRLAVDGIPPASGDNFVPIAMVDRARVQGLAILHQPVAPGRYSASIFATTSTANTGRGEINTPLMLASFEWSPAVKGADGKPPDKLPPVNLKAPGMSAFLTSASAPTFLRWTRTGRDFDFLNLPKFSKEKDSWSQDRRHVRELVAALDAKHHELTFELNGAAKTPVWLGPSIFGSPYPLHVHRHLGIITSYFLKELGRPAELFCRTAIAREKTAVLVAPNGKTVDVKNDPAYQPRDQIARVVEFETPAQILCDKNLSASPKYKQGYFDLVSTGFNNRNATNAHLYFRIVGPPAHQRAFTELKITLQNANDTGETSNPPKATIQLKWVNAPEVFAIGVYLILRQSDTGDASVAAYALLSNGTLDRIVPADAVKTVPRLKTAGLFVSVEAPVVGHEFWTDVSLLHASAKEKAAEVDKEKLATLDFDWLFSPVNNDEPAVSVSPGGLNTMAEAQARVIAVSPPIPIVRH